MAKIKLTLIVFAIIFTLQSFQAQRFLNENSNISILNDVSTNSKVDIKNIVHTSTEINNESSQNKKDDSFIPSNQSISQGEPMTFTKCIKNDENNDAYCRINNYNDLVSYFTELVKLSHDTNTKLSQIRIEFDASQNINDVKEVFKLVEKLNPNGLSHFYTMSFSGFSTGWLPFTEVITKLFQVIPDWRKFELSNTTESIVVENILNNLLSITKLNTLELYDVKLRNADCEVLSEIFKKNVYLFDLTIDNAGLSEVEIKTLLKSDSSIDEYRFPNNNINDEGLILILKNIEKQLNEGINWNNPFFTLTVDNNQVELKAPEIYTTLEKIVELYAELKFDVSGNNYTLSDEQKKFFKKYEYSIKLKNSDN